MYEQFMGDFTYRDQASRQVQLFSSFMNFRATSLFHLLYFSTYSGIKSGCQRKPGKMLKMSKEGGQQNKFILTSQIGLVE